MTDAELKELGEQMLKLRADNTALRNALGACAQTAWAELNRGDGQLQTMHIRQEAKIARLQKALEWYRNATPTEFANDNGYTAEAVLSTLED